jgi:hypothetical protein
MKFKNWEQGGIKMTGRKLPNCYTCKFVQEETLSHDYSNKDITTAVCENYKIIPRGIFFDGVECKYFEEKQRRDINTSDQTRL